MNKVLSSVLWVKNKPIQSPIDAETAHSFSEAIQHLEGHFFSVIFFAVDKTNINEAFEFFKFVEIHFPQSKKIIFSDQMDDIPWAQWMGHGEIFKIVSPKDISELDTIVHEAMIQYSQYQQNAVLLKLVNEQNEKLKSIGQHLEERVERREKYLKSSQKKLLLIQKELDLLKNALLVIHDASSVAEMERQLTGILKKDIEIEWVRILFGPQSSIIKSLKNSSDFKVYAVPLSRDKDTSGQILYGKKGTKSFTVSEQDFFHQLTDAIALAIDKITKLEQSEVLKQQWESTFDSIADAICITNEHFEIIRTNKAFSEIAQISFKSLIGQNCFRAFLNKDVKIKFSDEAFNLIESWEGLDKDLTFEISGQKVQFKKEDDSLYVIMFRNISEQRRFERQILENSKMAELGTISSSIAHELNNPIGGIINFIQLIKMDIDKKHAIYQDIEEMEKAAHKCKDIVENLLGFARGQDHDHPIDISLNEVIDNAIKITEIQSRSQGIEIEQAYGDGKFFIRAYPDTLLQALRNVLQNSLEAINERKKQEPLYKGKIQIQIERNPENYFVIIQDNGLGMSKEVQQKIFNPLFSTKEKHSNSGLGLTVAFKILQDHQGKIEISSQPNIGTTAKMIFPRLDFEPVKTTF